MSKPKILDKSALSVSFFRHELEQIKKRDDELTFRGGKTEEHINHLKPIDYEKAKELYKKIEELDVPRLKPEHIHKIIDLMPINDSHVKVVLQSYAVTVNDDNTKKIAAAVKEFLPKKS